MLTTELDYDLPSRLIATEPATPRDHAKLMIVDRRTGQAYHHHVRDLPQLIQQCPKQINMPQPGDLLVFNQTRVLPASFTAEREQTQGQVRGLYLNTSDRPDGCYWEVMLESRGKLREGEHVRLNEQSRLTLTEKLEQGRWLAKLDSPDSTMDLLERIGSPPLPPYIRKQRRHLHQPEIQPGDTDHYNTVFAADAGSVAAPTAGLHFTPALLDQLDHAGVRRAAVTLHIGLGTFAPVRTDRLEDHAIHSEWLRVPASTLTAIQETQDRGGRIIPIGTTTVRALESLPDEWPSNGDFSTQTQLFITPGTPGFSFRLTDALLTNFHLPRSTLLAMVAALPGVGLDRLKGWYQTAIEHSYRFYSYGDAMLIV